LKALEELVKKLACTELANRIRQIELKINNVSDEKEKLKYEIMLSILEEEYNKTCGEKT